MSPSCKRKSNDTVEAYYLDLNFKPITIEATTAARAFADEIAGYDGKAVRSGLAEAVGRLLGGMLYVLSLNKEPAFYRTMSTNSFGDEPVGYTSFKRAITGLEATGFIEKVAGSGERMHYATRYYIKPSVVSLADKHGLAVPDFDRHFHRPTRPRSISDPIKLTKSKPWPGAQGRRWLFDPTQPKPIELALQVNALNEFFAGIDIRPDKHWAFRRVFNQGNLPGFDWNKGGRLISDGASYQQMSQADRRAITLDGEPTIELDLKASQLTILHALLGQSFDPCTAYDGLPFPRHVAKSWVMMTLGYDDFQTRWSSGAKAVHVKEVGPGRGFSPAGEKWTKAEIEGVIKSGLIDLAKDHPIEDVRAIMLDRLPLLNTWPSCPVRWADLQYLESVAIIGAVEELAFTHGIPALPVHDSLIISASNQGLAKDIITEKFLSSIGTTPTINIK